MTVADALLHVIGCGEVWAQGLSGQVVVGTANWLPSLGNPLLQAAKLLWNGYAVIMSVMSYTASLLQPLVAV
jgi:hypothetical protein